MFMDRVLVKLSENAQMYKAIQKWQVKEPDCKPLRNTGNPLSLEKLISLFLIIFAGIIIALIVMIFELCGHNANSDAVPIHSRIEANDLLKLKNIMADIQHDLLRKNWPSTILLSQLGEISRRIENNQKND